MNKTAFISDGTPNTEPPTLGAKVKRLLFGPPRDLADHRLFHRLSVVAFLAWVGLGADGLSSSCYGPEETFRALGPHTYLYSRTAPADPEGGWHGRKGRILCRRAGQVPDHLSRHLAAEVRD
jgi:hypothetical protein